MKKDLTIVAEPRDTRGKNEARRLRARGLAPAIVYGAGGDPIAIAVSPKEMTRILQSATGHNTIFNIDVTGTGATPVMIVDYQRDPIKNNLLHIDLKRIDMTRRIAVRIPVFTAGDPVGVKVQGGLQELITREVEIECLPDDIPEKFTVDVSELSIGQSVRASDIPLSGSMKLLTPADSVISHVVALRAEEAPAEAAVAEGAAPAAAEPEVIKKGKKEEEGAAPEEKKGGKK